MAINDKTPTGPIDKSILVNEGGSPEAVPTEDIDIELQQEEGENLGDVDSSIDINEEEDHLDNLAEDLEDDVLGSLASELLGNYIEDKESRKDWEKTYTDGLDLLGFKYEERTKPFDGASGVTHPVLAESITQFQSHAYKELLPAGGPVRTRVVGTQTREKMKQAERVKEFMNYQITDVMQEYDPELDQMLFYLPLSGSAFKKIYYDAGLGRAVSKFVPSEDLVLPYLTTDLDSCDRLAHIIRMTENDLRKKQISGFYRDVDVRPASEDESDIKSKTDELEGISATVTNEQIVLLEFHVNLDLEGYEDLDDQGDETGIKLPYIVTVSEENNKILSIRRNWDKDDSEKMKKQYFVHFKFLPGLGFYGFGLIHMIGGLSRTATSALRQLIDAGTLSNLPAGFKARGIRVKDDDEPLQPGEFRDVDAPGGDLKASFQLLPYKEPSAILFQLLGFCVQAGQRFAAIADIQVGDSNQQAPVGTTLALLERGSRVMSAIHKRLHHAQKKEFKLLAKVFSEYLPPEYPYETTDGDKNIKVEDFDDRVDVIPISDPNIFSMSQRITLAQTQLELAKSEPGIHNMREAYMRMYEALGVKNVDDILTKEEDPVPKDPALEHSDLLEGKKLIAFPGQNHDAHIMSHLTFGASSTVVQAPALIVSLQKHVMEHISLKADDTVKVQQIEGMDEASQKAKYIADYITDIRQLSMQISGAGQQDPLISLKEKEIGIKGQDSQTKSKQAQDKSSIDKAKLSQKDRSDKAKIDSNEDIAELRGRIAREKINKSTKAPSKSKESFFKKD